MKSLLYAAVGIAVMALAFWAYRENYATQESIREVEALQREIGELRETLAVQKAEWAYLNRPERLRDLVASHWDKLRLVNFSPDHFGWTEMVPHSPSRREGPGGEGPDR